MYKMSIVNILALLAMILTLSGWLITIYLHSKQQNIQAFIAYTQKYDKIVSKMPLEWEKRYKQNIDIPDFDENHKQMFREYFHLCSQQFNLYINGLIEKNIWQIWEKEIERNLCTKLILNEWPKYAEEFKPYEEFHQYVNCFQTNIENAKGIHLATYFHKSVLLKYKRKICIQHKHKKLIDSCIKNIKV